jgi:hypothetical protein
LNTTKKGENLQIGQFAKLYLVASYGLDHIPQAKGVLDPEKVKIHVLEKISHSILWKKVRAKSPSKFRMETRFRNS